MMRYDRDMRNNRPARARSAAPHYGADYGGQERGWGMGYAGGALRSRGSFQAGQMRSGQNERDEFEWGGGYVGGRGYGGTNYDLNHGYRTGGTPLRGMHEGRGARQQRGEESAATRGGYAFAEWDEEPTYGPSRYGFGPYHDRLQRRRRDDEEIQTEVEEALFYDTWVDADRIEVEVEDGIVTLSGTLVDHQEVRYATDDAWDVEGVRGVRTRLDVDESAREHTGMRAGARRGGRSAESPREGGEAQTQSETEREGGAEGGAAS